MSDKTNEKKRDLQKPDSTKKNKLSKEDQEIISQVKRLPLSNQQKNEIIATMEMYSGPIPHPTILAGYEALYHGAAKKIIDNGVEESAHRRGLETNRQKRRGHLAWASMIALVIVCLLFIAGSFFLIMNDHAIIGSIFGGSSFVVLVGSFLNNVEELSDNDDISTNNNKEEKNKSAK